MILKLAQAFIANMSYNYHIVNDASLDGKTITLSVDQLLPPDSF